MKTKAFRYKAKNGPDQVVEGEMYAATTQEVVDELARKGHVATSVTEVKPESISAARRISLGSAMGVPLKDTIAFTRQLASLVKSGIPILRGLSILAEQTQHAYMRSVINDLAERVKDGQQLSLAMQQHPRVFSAFYTAMVSAGEETGALDTILSRVTAYYVKQYEFYAKVRSALAYPVLILIVGFGTIVFIFTNVIPRIIPLFSDLNVALPLPTRILIALSSFSRDHWLWGIMIAAVLGLIFNRALMTKAFRHYVSAIKLRIPLFGDLAFKSEVARFSRAFATALSNGVPMLKALSISLPIVRESVIKTGLETCMVELESGVAFGVGLRKSRLFPPFMYNLIYIGEESGSIDEALNTIAETYEADCDEYIRIMTTLLEPLFILVVGGIVGFIVAAVLLPVFQLNIVSL